MTERRSAPRKLHTNAVPALGLFFVLACVTPVIAAQNLPSECPDLQEAGLQVPITKLAAATVVEKQPADQDSATLSPRPMNTATTTPLVDAPAEGLSTEGLYGSRTSLADKDPADNTESATPQVPASPDVVIDIQTQFPGVSSVELQRFKRQMYRRDI
jgi:hypothetical protein